MLRFASLDQDAALVEQAREAADWLLREHPRDATAHVTRWMRGRDGLLDA
jgi:ATP-dependent DNA helicase RecG